MIFKNALQDSPIGKKYKNFFIDLDKNSSSDIDFYSYASTNYTLGKKLLSWYNIPHKNPLDQMKDLYQCVTNDPDILDPNSDVCKLMKEVIDACRKKGKRVENIGVDILRRLPEVCEANLVSGHKSKIDMYNKVDAIVTLINGKQYTFQIKTVDDLSQKFNVTETEKLSYADFFMFVDPKSKEHKIVSASKL